MRLRQTAADKLPPAAKPKTGVFGFWGKRRWAAPEAESHPAEEAKPAQSGLPEVAVVASSLLVAGFR